MEHDNHKGDARGSKDYKTSQSPRELTECVNSGWLQEEAAKNYWKRSPYDEKNLAQHLNMRPKNAKACSEGTTTEYSLLENSNKPEMPQPKMNDPGAFSVEPTPSMQTNEGATKEANKRSSPISEEKSSCSMEQTTTSDGSKPAERQSNAPTNASKRKSSTSTADNSNAKSNTGQKSGIASRNGPHKGEEWNPVDASVEKIDIEMATLPASERPCYQWFEGFRLPLGADGRQILLRKLRKVYHKNSEEWDAYLQENGVFFNRMPYATVGELFKLAKIFDVFDFAVRCSTDFSNDTALHKAGRRKRKLATKENPSATAEAQMKREQKDGEKKQEVDAENDISPKLRVSDAATHRGYHTVSRSGRKIQNNRYGSYITEKHALPKVSDVAFGGIANEANCQSGKAYETSLHTASDNAYPDGTLAEFCDTSDFQKTSQIENGIGITARKIITPIGASQDLQLKKAETLNYGGGYLRSKAEAKRRQNMRARVARELQDRDATNMPKTSPSGVPIGDTSSQAHFLSVLEGFKESVEANKSLKAAALLAANADGTINQQKKASGQQLISTPIGGCNSIKRRLSMSQEGVRRDSEIQTDLSVDKNTCLIPASSQLQALTASYTVTAQYLQLIQLLSMQANLISLLEDSSEKFKLVGMSENEKEYAANKVPTGHEKEKLQSLLRKISTHQVNSRIEDLFLQKRIDETALKLAQGQYLNEIAGSATTDENSAEVTSNAAGLLSLQRAQNELQQGFSRSANSTELIMQLLSCLPDRNSGLKCSYATELPKGTNTSEKSSGGISRGADSREGHIQDEEDWVDPQGWKSEFLRELIRQKGLEEFHPFDTSPAFFPSLMEHIASSGELSNWLDTQQHMDSGLHRMCDMLSVNGSQNYEDSTDADDSNGEGFESGYSNDTLDRVNINSSETGRGTEAVSKVAHNIDWPMYVDCTR